VCLLRDSPLFVGVVDADHTSRFLESVAPDATLTPADIQASGPTLEAADAVIVSLRTPLAAAVAAASLTCGLGGLLVLDGAPGDPADADALLCCADVLRADAAEAASLAGELLRGVGGTVRAANRLLTRGPSLVVLAAGDDGNVIAWPGGHLVVPLTGATTIDPTGAGDAFVAAFTVVLLRGGGPKQAGQAATDAAAAAVAALGARP
jgi:ribokinase